MVMKSNHSLLVNIVVGIIGGFIGGFVFGVLGISGDMDDLNIGSLVVAFVGSVILLATLRFLRT
jgi:uncharacterized membrane protein YeaQ/YmgE (transglycosylase-associated protein family)